MSFVVLFHEAAQADLSQAAAWYETESPGRGADFKNAVLKTVDLIAEQPRLFAIESRSIRGAPIDGYPKYRLYYRVRRTHVEIVSVFHASRDPKVWKRR